MSAIDLIRMGFAGVASLGAAMGGFAASQAPDQVIGVAAPQPPNIEARVFRAPIAPISFSLQEWDAGFELPVVAAIIAAAPEMHPWRFVGVIGEGERARAVFAAPDASARTLLVQVGDTLPDGRIIAAVASEHVLFGAMSGRPGQVAAATGIVGPAQISLFSGRDANAEATSAFEQAANAQAVDAAPAAPTPPVGGAVSRAVEPASAPTD